MTDAPSTEWPPEVQSKLARVAALSQGIDQHSEELDALYQERMDLFLDLRACDPPVPYTVIGEATGTQEAAVRISIAKEMKRCEAKAQMSVGPETDLGRRGRATNRIDLARSVRADERRERAEAGSAGIRRPRRT